MHTIVNTASAGQQAREPASQSGLDEPLQESPRAPCFHVVPQHIAHDTIFASVADVVQIVEATYCAHAQGNTVAPPSSFLRFPGAEANRIIALPAHLVNASGVAISGVKWIASFPGNAARRLPRASGVLILNDPQTGYPLACLEASVISAARTAASAVLAASWLNEQRRTVSRLGVVGAGLIAGYIVEFFLKTGWRFDELHVHDLNASSAGAFVRRFQDGFRDGIVQHDDAPSVVRASDLVVFATTATRPHVADVDSFAHRPIILHISLRDLSPDVILAAHNVVDDVDHCLSANTSAHLAEQRVKRRDFVAFTLPRILCGAAPPDRSRPIVFSPFGLGILDIAVGRYILEAAKAAGTATQIPQFFMA